MTKKISSILLVITLVLGTMGLSFANEQTEKTNYSINEYDMFKELSKRDVSELSSLGYSKQEVDDIKSYEDIYIKHIEMLSTLSEKALFNHGYSKEQIQLIKDFNHSEKSTLSRNQYEMDRTLSRLGASLSLNTYATGFSYDGDYTRGKLKYSWSWSGIPAFKTTDAVVASWNNWIVEDESCKVYYHQINSGSYSKKKSANFIEESNGTEGAGHEIDMAINDNYYYAKRGSGTLEIRSDVHAKKDFRAYIEYGHSQVVTSVGFSISNGGASGSINFSWGIKKADSDTAKFDF